MRRRLLNFATASSAALCLAAMVAWVGSYVRPSRFAVDGTALHNNSVEIGSEWAWYISFANGVLDIAPVASFYEWKIAYWKLVLAFLLLPGRWIQLRLRDRRRRLRAGLCQTCGYDLRASTERCPECGTPVLDKFAVR